MTREQKIWRLRRRCGNIGHCDEKTCKIYAKCVNLGYTSFEQLPDEKINEMYNEVFGGTQITENLTGVIKGKKRILDACCGSRMFYFDKKNPEVLYQDNRELETTLCDGRHLLIKPDVKMDFRNMKYADNSFKVVVFDPPHLDMLELEVG